MSNQSRRYSYSQDSLVIVLVGRHEHPFSVHKDTICAKSKFFEAACSSDRWREGTEKLVRLPEVKPRVFQAYVHWAYTSSVMLEIQGEDQTTGEEDEKTICIEASIIGDFLRDEQLRKRSIEIFLEKIVIWKFHMARSAIDRIWSATPTGSPLRIVVLEWTADNLDLDCFAGRVAKYLEEFVQEVAVLMMERLRTYRPRTDEQVQESVRRRLEMKSTQSGHQTK